MLCKSRDISADQLRKLAVKVEGISLAGGKAGGALSRGTDSAIVLRVVRSRARVNETRMSKKTENGGKG